MTFLQVIPSTSYFTLMRVRTQLLQLLGPPSELYILLDTYARARNKIQMCGLRLARPGMATSLQRISQPWPFRWPLRYLSPWHEDEGFDLASGKQPWPLFSCYLPKARFRFREADGIGRRNSLSAGWLP